MQWCGVFSIIEVTFLRADHKSVSVNCNILALFSKTVKGLNPGVISKVG